MGKKILHLQIPLINDIHGGQIKNNFAVTPTLVGSFVNMLRDQLGDEWEIISSPCNPSVSLDAENFYNFKMEQITKEELKNLIKTK
jgi:hypothetical protein